MESTHLDHGGLDCLSPHPGPCGLTSASPGRRLDVSRFSSFVERKTSAFGFNSDHNTDIPRERKACICLVLVL